MYTKKVLIFNQAGNGFSAAGRQLCGMIKLVSNGGFSTATVFVTNADIKQFGEWWVVLYVNDNIYVHNLETLNNCTFAVPETNLNSLAGLLVKRDNGICRLAAEAALGKTVNFAMRTKLSDLINSADASGKVNIASLQKKDTSPVAATPADGGESVQPAAVNLQAKEATEYEKFVASTQNFYPKDSAVPQVEQLRSSAKSKIKSIEEYSSAFERYYAMGRGENYYDSVKREITRLFVQFPPYYPLIEKYPNSYFIRIDFPSGGKYFVLGLVEKQGIVRYICYGVPGQKDGFTDKDFVYVENNPDGFWMLFQDAETGQLTAM